MAGEGIMSTAIHPIFSLSSEGTLRGPLIGIAAYDVLTKHLFNINMSYEYLISELARRIGRCNMKQTDLCQLQVFKLNVIF